MTVEVEEGSLRRVLPHAGNRATVEGPCLKGLSYVERVASPDRILHPLRRSGDGSFHRVSWDEALDEITRHLVRVRDTFGPQAVLYYAASGTKGLLNGVGTAFWRLFGGYTGTYGDLCWPAGLEATRLTLGENKHNAPWDLSNARLVVLWGTCFSGRGGWTRASSRPTSWGMTSTPSGSRPRHRSGPRR